MLTREQAAGCRATIKCSPGTSRRWRESIFVSALDSIDFLESQLAAVTAELDRAVELLREAHCFYKCDDHAIRSFLAAYDSKRGETST